MQTSQTFYDPSTFIHPIISERAIDEPRPLKVIYIGAGISGIIAAIRFRQAVSHLDFVIYEKNADIGGTWLENRYPGCACDIPSHSYQLSFEPWTGWSNFYAGSAEIWKYWKMVAEKYDVEKHVRFRHKCIEARWNEDTSKWTVQIQDLDTGIIHQDSADVLMTGTGTLNEWQWPDIKGLHDFEGPILHSASWDESLNLKDKTVAVIGSGSSAIQIVPALAGQVKSMDHYVRSRTWIVSQVAEDVLNARRTENDDLHNFKYTAEEKERWQNDPKLYATYRKGLESSLNSLFAITQRGSKHQSDAVVNYTQLMKDRLTQKPELIDSMIPDYPPLCKRITPGPGYLEALASPKVDVISTKIAHVDSKGITTTDGVHRPVDAIVCATGFVTTPSAGFPIYGRNNVNLRVQNAQRARSYMSICVDEFPNFFQSLGPNSFQGGGSLLIVIEQLHNYIAQILRSMAFEHIKTIEPKTKQVDNFTNFCDEYFKRTVYTTNCSSWYKTLASDGGGSSRVTALWPGSVIHALQAFKSVRWQDFELTSPDENDFGWFGNGWSTVEKSGKPSIEDLTWYLKPVNFLNSGEAAQKTLNLSTTEEVTSSSNGDSNHTWLDPTSTTTQENAGPNTLMDFKHDLREHILEVSERDLYLNEGIAAA